MRLLVAIALCMTTVACSSIPEGRVAVDEVEVVGAEAVSADELLDAIATEENPRFLGLLEGVVYDYALFDEAILERDLARMERAYRQRGYYDAHVRAGRIHAIGDDEVRVEILVEEGEPVVVKRLDIEGVDRANVAVQFGTELVRGSELRIGEPFDERSFERADERLTNVLHNFGYPWGEVYRDAEIDLVTHEAVVTLHVAPGPRAKLGEVSVTGLGELPPGPLRGALDLTPGDLYDHREIVRAQQDALAMGTFSAVEVVPDLSDRPDDIDAVATVPVDVKVTPSELRTVRLGLGVQLDAIQSDVHGLVGWESRNFLGGARKFRVDVKPGLTLYPLRINNWVAPNQPLPKGKVEVSLDQPAFLEPRTTGVIEADFSAFPVLLKTDPQPDDPVVGYLDTHGSVGLVRTFWRLQLALRKHVEYARPFAYVDELDPRLSDVVLGYPELVARLDLRDDPVAPHEGLHVENHLQSALYLDGRDIKVQPRVKGYIPLADELTLSLRTTVGFLFPFDYGDSIERQVDRGEGAETEGDVRDLQLMYFRGFFGGGPSSNRGYPPRTLGPHAPVPFLNPASAAAALECGDEDATAACSVPVGGMTMWDASIEIRYPIYDPLRGATFCDAGDVAPGQTELRFNRLHLSCGTGLRYGTPVGAIRLDLALRIPGAQVIGEDAVPRIEGDPGTIFGAPLNVSFGIGEAY